MFQNIMQIVNKAILWNEEGWHYLAVKKLSILLRGIASKHHGDLSCMDCFHSFAKENKRESHETLCEEKKFFITL